MTRICLRLLLTVIWLPLSACAPAAAYPIKDSGVPASEAAVVWLDNERVLFHGAQITGNPTAQSPEQQFKNSNSLRIWDTTQGKVTEYIKMDYVTPLCVHNDTLTYFLNGQIVTAKVRDGRLSDEHTKPLAHPFWINPFSCRYYESSPPWVIKGQYTTPLLEEHGYIVWGTSDTKKALSEKRQPTLNRPGATGSVQLAIPEGAGGEASYASFRQVYLIPSSAYRDLVTGAMSRAWPKGKPMPLWWLSPDGTMTEDQFPYHPFMADGSSRGFLPVQGGVFAWSHALALGNRPGNSGGYLAHNGTVHKLIAGMVHNPVISPDGCRVAFFHNPRDPEYGVGRRERNTVKVLDLCDVGGR